jgi:hypothetical protein
MSTTPILAATFASLQISGLIESAKRPRTRWVALPALKVEGKGRHGKERERK